MREWPFPECAKNSDPSIDLADSKWDLSGFQNVLPVILEFEKIMGFIGQIFSIIISIKPACHLCWRSWQVSKPFLFASTIAPDLNARSPYLRPFWRNSEGEVFFWASWPSSNQFGFDSGHYEYNHYYRGWNIGYKVKQLKRPWGWQNSEEEPRYLPARTMTIWERWRCGTSWATDSRLI
jgi:hypothetical protein